MKYKFIFLISILILRNEISFCQSTYPFALSVNKDVPLTAFAGLTFGLGLYTDAHHKKHWLTEAEFNSLDRVSVCGIDTGVTLRESVVAGRLSDGIVMGSVLFAVQTSMVVIPVLTKDKTTYGTNAVMLLQAFAINQGFTDLFKNYIHHARPYCYYRSKYPTFKDLQLENNFGDVNRSFFSGHTSTAAVSSFLTADILAAQTDNDYEKALIWSIGAAIPAIVGYLRVRAGKHFPIDVTVGYITGAVVGIGVAELHKVKAVN